MMATLLFVQLPLRTQEVRNPILGRFTDRNLSVIKKAPLKEGVQLQFRAEAIDAMNHPQFLPPNTTPSSSACRFSSL